MSLRGVAKRRIRGFCPVCRREFGCSKAGAVIQHGWPRCDGVGQRVVREDGTRDGRFK